MLVSIDCPTGFRCVHALLTTVDATRCQTLAQMCTAVHDHTAKLVTGTANTLQLN